MIRATFLLLAVTLSFVSTNAIDAFPQLVRRASTTDATNGANKLRSIITAPKNHFDQVFVMPEPREVQECVSCFDGQHDRQLQLIPKIQAQIKNAVNTTGVDEDVFIDPILCGNVALFVLDLIEEGVFFNATVADLFDTLTSFPVLLAGVIVVAILPIVVAETISIVMQVPILCVLGFQTSILYGSCGLSANEIAFMNSTFPNGVQLKPDNTTDAATEAANMLNLSVSEDFFGLLDSITLETVFTGIANLLGSCAEGGGRRTMEMGLEDLDERHQHQCQLELFTCEMSNVMAMMGQKNRM
jgi:hypothetical protein